jgi:DHA2 family multidrug resistance protein
MFIAVFVAIVPEPLDLKLLKQCDWVGIATMAVGLGSLIAMLEQGQQDDWFGSEFIRTCGLLAGILISVFIVWELFFAKSPLVHLRLLASRNLGISSVIGFVLGVGLYGTIYLIPVYLSDVQGYSPRLIGETVIWVGLPQLLVFPFLPLLQKKFDPVTAKQQAYGALQAIVQRQASIMAFNDGFLIVGFSLILGSIIVWFCKRPAQVAVAAG